MPQHMLQQVKTQQTKPPKPIQGWVLGASGYSGAELCRLLSQHSGVELNAAFAFSEANSGPLSALYPALAGQVSIELQQWNEAYLPEASSIDVVFLALPHEASHTLVPQFLAQGCCVVDLSAAYRLTDLNHYPQYYQFKHNYAELLAQRVYALTHHQQGSSLTAYTEAQLLSMPGCYPTAATLALLPLLENNLLAEQQMPVITAVSGVSGAGRKANLSTSFCEVSLRPYGVLNHRHQCEIEQNLQREVIFVPQLGNFKRGIIATCAARLANGVDASVVHAAFAQRYAHAPSVRLRTTVPQIDDVAHTPFCDIHVSVVGTKVVVIAAIDNLLKGAASQAVEAINLKYGFEQMEGML